MKEQAQRSKHTFFIGSQVTLLLGFTLIFSLVFAGAFYWFYTFTENITTSRLRQELRNTVSAAASGVDADEFVALARDGVVRADGYTDDPRYWKHVDWLVRISKTNPKAQVYSYIAGENPKEVVFIGSIGAVVASPGGDPPPWGAKFKEHYTSSGVGNANLLTGLDHLGVQVSPYKDQWGTWLSGYGPILNAKGEKVGAIGVDIPYDYVEEVHNRILDNVAGAFSVTYAILFALVYAVSLVLTRPIVTLTRIAAYIADGNYSQDLTSLTKGRFRNEVTSLADVFEMMMHKIREREQSLIHQVEELKIKIDEVRAQKEIGEIVDTEFFQSLREKVKKIRNDRKRGDDQTPT
jgi:HAMP domain-containing protein